jgi:hypothetical protein
LPSSYLHLLLQLWVKFTTSKVYWCRTSSFNSSSYDVASQDLIRFNQMCSFWVNVLWTLQLDYMSKMKSFGEKRTCMSFSNRLTKMVYNHNFFHGSKIDSRKVVYQHLIQFGCNFILWCAKLGPIRNIDLYSLNHCFYICNSLNGDIGRCN